MFGACEEHPDREDTPRGELYINQVRANTEDDEALANHMNILAISDFDPTSTEENRD